MTRSSCLIVLGFIAAMLSAPLLAGIPSCTIEQAIGQADPTNVNSVDYTVTFSEDVTGFTTVGVDVSSSTATGASVASVTPVSASVYTVTVNGMTGSGLVVAVVLANSAVSVSTAQNNTASTSTDNQITYDIDAPTVSVNQAVGQADPASTSPINFRVIFSESVTGFTSGDIAFTGSTAGGTLAAAITGGPADYNVAITGMTTAGDVIIILATGAASDAATNTSAAPTNTDNQVTWTPPVPSVTVTAPNGGESVSEGNTLTITWTNGGGFSGNVDIVLSLNSGGTFPIPVVTNIANTGSFNWSVFDLGATTTTCRIRVQANAGGTPQDDSDADFTINNVTIAVTAPNGGEVLTVAASTNITWTQGSFTGNVDIDLSTDSGGTFPVSVAANIVNTGTFNWTIPNNPSTLCRIRVRATATPTLTDNSNADFTIQVGATPTITVTAPNGGEVLTVAASTNITWTNGGGFTGNVDIDLSTNGGSSFTVNVATNIANTGTFNWTIPNNPGTTCRIRVQANAGGTPTDNSNADFTIQVAATPTVTVTAPNGGESLTVGNMTNITWTNGGGFTGNVTIDLSTNGGGSFTVNVATNIANTGTFSWTIPNNPGTTCRIRVQAAAGGTPTDSSNANFTIAVATPFTVTVTSPNGGESRVINSGALITWTNGGGFTGNVDIQLSTDSGASFPNTVASNISNIGFFNWTVPNLPTSSARIRVRATGSGTPSDDSNANFTIVAGTLGGAVGDAGGTSAARQVTRGGSADGLHFYVANDGQSPGPLTITSVRITIDTNDNASNLAITHLAGVRLQNGNGSNLETVLNGGSGWSVAGATITVTFGGVTPLSVNSPVGGSVDFYVELFFTNVTVIGTPSPAFACNIDNTAGTAINGGGTSNYPGEVAGGSVTLNSSIPGDGLDDSDDDTTSCTLSENESFLWLALGLLALAVALRRRGRGVEGR